MLQEWTEKHPPTLEEQQKERVRQKERDGLRGFTPKRRGGDDYSDGNRNNGRRLDGRDTRRRLWDPRPPHPSRARCTSGPESRRCHRRCRRSLLIGFGEVMPSSPCCRRRGRDRQRMSGRRSRSRLPDVFARPVQGDFGFRGVTNGDACGKTAGDGASRGCFRRPFHRALTRGPCRFKLALWSCAKAFYSFEPLRADCFLTFLREGESTLLPMKE